MNEYPTVKIIISKNSNVHQVDDSSSLPQTGQLISLEHFGWLDYTLVGQDNDEILVTGNNLYNYNGSTYTAVPSYIGIEFHIARDTVSTLKQGNISNALSTEIYAVVPPSFIDNALMLSKLTNQSWYDYDIANDKVSKTTLNYRGLLPYDPTDFVPISQSAFIIKDGKDTGRISNTDGSNIIYYDYQKLSHNLHLIILLIKIMSNGM